MRRRPRDTDLYRQLVALKPKFVAAAQKILDDWKQDDEGWDEEFGSGGVCHEIADAIANVVYDAGLKVETTRGEDHEINHYWTIVLDNDQAFGIDIPPNVYETGAGYTWKKKHGVELTTDGLVIEEVPRRYFDHEFPRKQVED